jgi:hypothetical protein
LNVVDGRSSSNTLARDRPTPRMPCIWPAAPRDSRRQNQIRTMNGARMITQFSSSVPKPGDEVEPVICTPFVCSSSSRDWLACGGMTTV